VLDTLASLPGIEQYAGTVDGQPVFTSPPSLGHRALEACGGDGWYYGASDDYSVAHYSVTGELRRIIRRPGVEREVTADIAATIRSRILEEPSRSPDALRRWQANIPLPETMPAYEDILVSDDGYLWVHEYRLRDEVPLWNVFDEEGRFLGSVETPIGGRVWQIGADYLLGQWDDEMGVERVHVYELIKP
jgi:hypothetical protein